MLVSPIQSKLVGVYDVNYTNCSEGTRPFVIRYYDTQVAFDKLAHLS